METKLDVKITKKDGSSFTFLEYGVIPRDFRVSSIAIEPNYASVEGRSGRVDYGATYGVRTITIPQLFRSYDLQDFPLLRDELFGLLTDVNPFYIQELRSNGNTSGKRYKVRLSDTFEYEQRARIGTGDLTFETAELPYAESIGTTQTIERNGIDANSALWGFGMGLIADDEALKYTHSGTSFRIYNAGNVPIHPFEQELKIIIKNAYNSTEFLQLKNLTNGTVFKLNEGLPLGKELVLDGPIITIDGLNALRRTNRQFLELEPGWNEFELTGVSSARVEFDFRFYYK